MKVYFASPLFAQSERLFNQVCVDLIRDIIGGIDVYLPQENLSVNDKEAYASAEMIARADTNELLQSDVLIAVLDGSSIDAGVASEIGAFYMTGRPVFGLYTDVRQQGADNQKKLDALKEVGECQFPYINLYTTGLIKLSGGNISTTIEDLIDEISKYYNKWERVL